ncbi:MAG: efflux RND transporter periplasmic adaptor subunit [Flavobacteriales bacterium]|nr:efflux RND transporter periplasmic adaptor subunit [Flavobacteriales bacterium]
MAVAILVALALWSSSFATSRVRVETAKVSIGTVEKGLFKEFIPVTGTVQPIQTVFLDALEGGTVKHRFVEDGTHVKAGDPLIELSNPQLHMDAINREAQLLDQQNNLRNTRLAMDQQTTRLRDDLLNLDKDLKRLERDQHVNDRLLRDSLLAQNTYMADRENLEYMREKRKLVAANVRADSLFRLSQLGSITGNLELIQQNLRFLRDNLQNPGDPGAHRRAAQRVERGAGPDPAARRTHRPDRCARELQGARADTGALCEPREHRPARHVHACGTRTCHRDLQGVSRGKQRRVRCGHALRG